MKIQNTIDDKTGSRFLTGIEIILTKNSPAGWGYRER